MDVEGTEKMPIHYVAFTPLQNTAGAPDISLPMGFSRNGLPIGVHFAAAFGQEKPLLELAFELKEARPWPLIGQQQTIDADRLFKAVALV